MQCKEHVSALTAPQIRMLAALTITLNCRSVDFVDSPTDFQPALFNYMTESGAQRYIDYCLSKLDATFFEFEFPDFSLNESMFQMQFFDIAITEIVIPKAMINFLE